MPYDHLEIEARWQRYWDAHGTFRATRRSGRPKRYVLDMFPYPSGVGLHVGHPEGYTATDIVARVARMRGYDVLHPMGWDAFGLPAEQHAIETGQHPARTTAENIATFKRQLKMLGFSYDWSREIDTTDPRYVRWTQWIFLQLFRRGLAYQATVPVNWCPALGTVLANEEVVDGKSERGGHPVYRTPIRQWMLKITAYADRLAEDLALVDWPEGTLTAQRRWIGRSEGAEIVFGVDGHPDARIAVVTTRPDTLMGATYVVLAPEHELTRTLSTPARREAVVAYVEAAARKSELDRVALAKTKTGVPTGAEAIHPITGARLPIWVADYVLGGYGTGAVMAVPGHDERDFEFATAFALPIVEVVSPDGRRHDALEAAYVVETAMTKHNDQTQIRDVIEDWAAGSRSKDVARVRRHEVEELMHVSLAPPLVADEKAPYGLEKWFKTWDGPLGYELRDLEVVSGEGVAFSHSLNHVTGTQRGKKADVWSPRILAPTGGSASSYSRPRVGPAARARQGRRAVASYRRHRGGGDSSEEKRP